MRIAENLGARLLSAVDLAPVALVEQSTSVCDTVAAMNEGGTTCAVVMTSQGLQGVFTDRDIVHGVAGHPDAGSDPISTHMTQEVVQLTPGSSVLEALHVMNEERIRHVVVVDDDGDVTGAVSDGVIIGVLDQLLRDPEVREDHELGAQHGLLFIDFTGLSLAKPVTVQADEPLARAIHHMQSWNIGSVLVVDARETLVGVLTERDLQHQIVCQVADIEGATVGDYMTSDPVSLSPRAKIVEGFHAMAAHGFTHLPLTAESGRPVGIASFRDLAEYAELTVTTVD